MDFQGDQRLNGVGVHLDQINLYPSDHGGGTWWCEVQIAYDWRRDMSQDIIVTPDGDWYMEEWTSGADNTMNFRFNAALGERIHDEYSFFVSLGSYEKFSVGQSFVFTPKTGNTSSTITATLTSSDILDGAEFEANCVN